MARKYYPIHLSLRGKCCVLVGFGRVGQRKLQRLLAMGSFGPASIMVFDPQIKEVPKAPNLTVYQQTLDETCIDRADIVFACTNDPHENARICALCRAKHVLCNAASDPDNGDVALPAIIDADPLCLTLSTQGTSPALAKKWRKELEVWAASKHAMLCCMARLRPLLVATMSSEENAALFTTLANGPLETYLHQGETAKALQYLTTHLPPHLKDVLPEIVNDLT
ncbi:MAG: bifunctional precorrin-2 dehydrogenase/sirohydrochlorin ferrochelatase [Desulfovibrio sp.]|nr:bifunctional precorrin-2 dehydrogenase/sirohydrochlorin ferrochelatase [Desulfovibrio sp.]